MEHISYGARRIWFSFLWSIYWVIWNPFNQLNLSLIFGALVPETLRGALEDIDVLFETNPTWLVGPDSQKKLAQIIANREAQIGAADENAENDPKKNFFFQRPQRTRQRQKRLELNYSKDCMRFINYQGYFHFVDLGMPESTI